MAFRVTIKSAEPGGLVRNQVNVIKKLADRQIEAIAKRTAEVMKDKIHDSISRANSSGNLVNSIFASPIDGGWGVGDIDFLNQQAPYWAHVNFGSQAVGASHSHRVPTGAFQPGNSQPVPGGSGQRWIPGSGNFSFIPTRPISPLNYIDKTLSQINNIIRDTTRTVR